MVHGERKPFVNSSTVCEQKIQLDNRTRSARPHVIYSPILLSSSLQCPPMSTFLYILSPVPGHHPYVHSSTSYLTPMSTHVHLPLYIITGSWTSPPCTFVDILPHTHVHYPLPLYSPIRPNSTRCLFRAGRGWRFCRPCRGARSSTVRLLTRRPLSRREQLCEKAPHATRHPTGEIMQHTIVPNKRVFSPSLCKPLLSKRIENTHALARLAPLVVNPRALGHFRRSVQTTHATKV